MTDNEILLACILGLLVALCLYFVPAILATRREHPNIAKIFLLNAFLGWTFLGWIVALVWAYSDLGPDPWQSKIANRKRGAWTPLLLSLAMISAVVVGAVAYRAAFRSATVQKLTSAARALLARSAANDLDAPIYPIGATPGTKTGGNETSGQSSSGAAIPADSPSGDHSRFAVDAIAQGYGPAHQAIICGDLASVSAMYRKFQQADDSLGSVDLLPGCDLVPTGTRLRIQPVLSGVRVQAVLPSGKRLDGMTMREMVVPL